ncbi:neoverrucotoxin subunit alpha-like isoform X2 [Syngnathoides biaculeatus]|uniref:neoverrucotoxin subunit alpha-like isoform X2 n=1 Tax=Syngnathoides biaculeatus TaxID=300417 RepID=UPI002ADE5974|nr:neoverrucotoxin subunit alpha-like isoform X2 [Syngnathoides biaculeatus]XP_061703753.1 neoverrucotoxin subunit alpha-like isoform X2 [Syngnathoides biaculeatus]
MAALTSLELLFISASMAETMKVVALGQPFTLGMLYDARKDELIPGFTLWDRASLDSQTTETTQKSSSFKITASDTIESRSSLMDIEASLSMSFLGGLVQVGGSAKYLNDQKKFKNQSRVTFQYKATTTFKQLSLPALGPLNSQQKQIIEEGKATHLVTGILYGANAVFVFDSEKLEASSVQNIQGSMQVVIKKIPTFKIEGSAKIHLSEKEQALTNKFSCTFFGDLILEKNPATFVQAVETYCELPTLLGTKDNNAPLLVWLYPLQALYNKAAVLVKDLSVSLSRTIQDAMEEQNQVKMRCNDSLFSSAAQYFPVIRKNMSSFQKLCSFYQASLKRALSTHLPSIRDGKEEESLLAKVFNDREKSPFHQENLNKWLEKRERDINVIQSCVDMIMYESNAYVVRTKSELDKVVLTPGVTNVLCFVFTDLETNDPCLDAMAKYLDTSQVGGTNEDSTSFTNEVLIKMRENAQTFLKYAKPLKDSSSIKFLITAMTNKKYKGSSIYHYKDGLLESDKFTVPSLPPVRTITNRNDVIWHATELTLDENTVNEKLTLSEENKKVSYGRVRSYPYSSERFVDYPQVLCKEPLRGRHYWEAEWRGHVNVVAAFESTPRKGVTNTERNFTDMFTSWGLHASHKFEVIVESYFSPIMIFTASSSGMQKVGVFLDVPGSTLSFYGVSGNKLKHCYTFPLNLDQPVYAGFSVLEKQSYAKLTY